MAQPALTPASPASTIETPKAGWQEKIRRTMSQILSRRKAAKSGGEDEKDITRDTTDDSDSNSDDIGSVDGKDVDYVYVTETDIQGRFLTKDTSHVPHEHLLRGHNWVQLLLVQDLKRRFSDEVYPKLVSTPSPWMKNIDKDIRRTFPTNAFFHDHPERLAALHRITCAYSVYDAEVGYSQGIAFIVGYLYMHMSEEDAFWSLVQFMHAPPYNMRALFNSDCPSLMLCLKEFDYQLQRLMPRLAQHLAVHHIDATMYATQWFLTLFVYRFPPQSLPIIWDRFIKHGIVAVFQVGLIVLAHHHKTLMSLNEEEFIPFFNALAPVPDDLLRTRTNFVVGRTDLKYINDIFVFPDRPS